MMRSDQSALLAALEGRQSERLSVWFMRQAGRSLSEYHNAKQGVTMLDVCLNLELAVEITCRLVRRHGADAAVLLFNIMIPLVFAGVEVMITAGARLVFEQPVNSITEVNRLAERWILDASVVGKAMAPAAAELGEDAPVIGSADAPFTSAAYLVEGHGSRDHLGARTFMHAEPAARDRLLSWCADLSGKFLCIQAMAGARAVQLFDSWVGMFRLADYTTRIAPYSRRALESVSVPRIHFGIGTGHLLEAMVECGSKAIGIDHHIPLDEVVRRLPGKVLQGNVDPARLAAGWENLVTHTRDVVE